MAKPYICMCGHHRADHNGMGPSRGVPIMSACGWSHCKCNQWRPSKRLTAIWERIEKVVKQFAEQYDVYSTMEGAHDCCREASGIFCEMLHKAGVTEALVDEIAVVDGTAHKAVRIRNLWVDWTARQFKFNAAFPRIETTEYGQPYNRL